MSPLPPRPPGASSAPTAAPVMSLRGIYKTYRLGQHVVPALRAFNLVPVMTTAENVDFPPFLAGAGGALPAAGVHHRARPLRAAGLRARGGGLPVQARGAGAAGAMRAAAAGDPGRRRQRGAFRAGGGRAVFRGGGQVPARDHGRGRAFDPHAAEGVVAAAGPGALLANPPRHHRAGALHPHRRAGRVRKSAAGAARAGGRPEKLAASRLYAHLLRAF
jgi:hypothetical protein